MMQVDDGPQVELESRPPESYVTLKALLNGKVLKADFQGMFDPEARMVDISLAGFKESYSDAISYLVQHGAPALPAEANPGH